MGEIDWEKLKEKMGTLYFMTSCDDLENIIEEEFHEPCPEPEYIRDESRD